MRLIIEFVVSDGCSYSFTETVPVAYESAEAFAVDFEIVCYANKQNWQGFMFANHSWNSSDFFGGYNMETKSQHYYQPSIFTVDEWFSHHGVENAGS